MGCMQNEPRSELLNFLHVARILSLVWMLLGGLVALIALLELVVSLVYLTPSPGSLLLFVYAALWGMTDLFIVNREPHWRARAEKGDFVGLHEDLLLWVVLGLIFGVVPGVILLVIYLRLDPKAGGDWATGTPSNPPTTATSPPPYAPPSAPPPLPESSSPPPPSG